MKFRLTVIAAALAALAIGPVYAGGSGGCNYGSKWRSTSVEPQEQSEASKKLASLSMPIAEQDTTSPASASGSKKDQASTSQTAETTSAQ